MGKIQLEVSREEEEGEESRSSNTTSDGGKVKRFDSVCLRLAGDGTDIDCPYSMLKIEKKQYNGLRDV